MQVVGAAHDASVQDLDSHSVIAEMVSIPDRRDSVTIKREQLIQFVENALSGDAGQKGQRDGGDDPVISDPKEDCSILKQLKEFQVDRRANLSREQVMRQQIGEELHCLDSLVAMLSMMDQNQEKTEEFERSNAMNEEDDDSDFTERQDQREKETVQYMRYIRDRRLLSKMVRLRKVIQYFLESKGDDGGVSTKDAATSKIDSNLHSFFRPIVFLSSPDLIRKTVQQSLATQRAYSRHHRESNPTAKSLTHRILYRGENAKYNESVELMLFKLGYRPTFSNRQSEDALEVVIARNHFDIIMIDSDDIRDIKETLQTVYAPKIKGSVNILFLVSNYVHFQELTAVAMQYGVQIILRKPMVFRDLQHLFKQCGLFTKE